jgi:hypothetical protein
MEEDRASGIGNRESEETARGFAPTPWRTLRFSPDFRERVAAIHELSREPIPICWRILHACDDPHPEVREAVRGVLQEWFRDDELRRLVEPQIPREVPPVEVVIVPPEGFLYFSENQRLNHLDLMPKLLNHPDAEVASLALETLRDFGEVSHFEAVSRWLDEPRSLGSVRATELFNELGEDQRDELTQRLMQREELTPAQLVLVIDSLGVRNDESFADFRFPIPDSGSFEKWKSHPAPVVRCSFVRLLVRWGNPLAGELLLRFLDDRDETVQWETLRLLNLAKIPIPEKTVGFLLTSPEDAIRLEAVETLFRQNQQSEWIEELLNDPSQRVQELVRQLNVG